MSRCDPFLRFAFDSEVPLMSCRSKLCAAQAVLNQSGSDDGLDFDDLDAVRTLIMEAWRQIKDMDARLSEAFAAANEQNVPVADRCDEAGRLHIEGGAPRLERAA